MVRYEEEDFEAIETEQDWPLIVAHVRALYDLLDDKDDELETLRYEIDNLHEDIRLSEWGRDG